MIFKVSGIVELHVLILRPTKWNAKKDSFDEFTRSGTIVVASTPYCNDLQAIIFKVSGIVELQRKHIVRDDDEQVSIRLALSVESDQTQWSYV